MILSCLGHGSRGMPPRVGASLLMVSFLGQRLAHGPGELQLEQLPTGYVSASKRYTKTAQEEA
jgi:hypothetical protein